MSLRDPQIELSELSLLCGSVLLAFVALGWSADLLTWAGNY